MHLPGTYRRFTFTLIEPVALAVGEAAGDSMFEKRAKAPARAAFTLIELLVVVAIIAVLAALLLPALQKSRDRARMVTCSSVVRSLAIGNSQYAGDNNEFMVHGVDMSYANWGVTANGTRYYSTNIFDDDWYDGGWDGSAMQVGRNKGTGGAQNICGVGQLMFDSYIPATAEAIACTESDTIDQPDFAWGMKTLADVRRALKANWQADSYSGNPSYSYYGTTFVVRGPLLRTTDRQADRTAMFAEHEQSRQTIIPSVPNKGSPLPYWSRRHKEGMNVAYADGHAAIFKDQDRHITYWTNQTYNYGSGYALQGGAYDNPR